MSISNKNIKQCDSLIKEGKSSDTTEGLEKQDDSVTVDLGSLSISMALNKVSL